MSLFAAFSICKVAKDAVGVAGSQFLNFWDSLLTSLGFFLWIRKLTFLCWWSQYLYLPSKFVYGSWRIIELRINCSLSPFIIKPLFCFESIPTFKRIIRNGLTKMFSNRRCQYSKKLKSYDNWHYEHGFGF